MTDQKTIIVATRFGRMANRLAMFANLIALAEDRRCRIVNPTFQSYASEFENLADNFYCAYPRPLRPSLFDRVPIAGQALRSVRLLHHCTRMATTVARLVPLPGVVIADRLSGNECPEDASQGMPTRGLDDGSTVLMRDWGFRVPTLVEQHAALIRSFLRPIAPIEAEGLRAVQALRETADVAIGVHIRRGDYETFKGGRYYFPIARYLAWMQDLAAALSPQRTAFLLCSDEALGAEAFPNLAVGFGPGSPLGDLVALSACDLLIGPVSTFTQWASFYGDTPLWHLHGTDDRPVLAAFTVSCFGEIP